MQFNNCELLTVIAGPLKGRQSVRWTVMSRHVTAHWTVRGDQGEDGLILLSGPFRVD
jgi:hypothetical protein